MRRLLLLVHGRPGVLLSMPSFRKRSSRIALCGILSALAVVIMFLTGIVPFGTFVLPALAGLLLVVVVVEVSGKWAFCMYLTVAALSLFVSPDREAAMAFILFFGYYPVLKGVLERLPGNILPWIVKFAVFNAAIAVYYLALVLFIGTEAWTEGLGVLTQWAPLIFFGGGNLMFLVYDIALTRVITMYVRWFRVKFLGR